MMKDVIIKIDQNSMVYKQETVLGISYENLQGKIIFKFLGTFPKGTAYLEYERGTEKGYLQMNQVGEEYQLEIKSSLLTKEGRIYLQLRVTEDANPDGIPVFKSNKFYLEVKEAINATKEIPDEYPKWIDIANEKIKEMDNLNITTERVEDGVDIILTDKKGVTTRTEVKDGKKGDKGDQGEPGAVKMQVVDTLPETGETDTIYLVKKSNPGEQNLYDEYVYTDTGWEHIGDTSVDLSNYYTKEESDKNLNARIPIFNLPVSDTSTSFTSGEPVENASAIINFLYSLGDFTGHAIVHNNYNPDYARFQDVLATIEGINKQRSEYVFKGVYNIGANYTTELYGVNINIYGTWTNNVFTANRVRVIKSYDPITPITVSDYINDTNENPVQGKVIKKYIDDNIKTYTAGDNITISDDNIINCTINDNTLYIGPISMNSTMINLNDYKDALTTLINNNLDKAIYIVIKGYNDKILFGTYSFATPVTTGSTYVRFLCTFFDSSNHDSFSAKKIHISYERSVDTKLYTVTDFNIMENIPIPFTRDVLTKTNTTSYTPTADYHPATKKYVDDNILLSKDKCFYFLEAGVRYDMASIITDTDTLDKLSQIMTDYYPKYLANNNLCCVIFGKDDTGASNGCFVTLQGKGTKFYYTYPYRPNYDRRYGYIGCLDIKGTWNNSTQTYIANNKSAIRIISYTPTTDDNPATKKYVDDQVGNINTVLATLTTVSEVSK